MPTRDDPSPRWGVWLVGARGSVAVTMTMGWAAIVAGLAETDGLVTELDAMADADFPAWEGLVIGGHDVIDLPVGKRAEQLESAGVVPDRLSRRIGDTLDDVEGRIRPGVTAALAAEDPREALVRLTEDLTSFARSHRLGRLVVINVASTEPPMPDHPSHASADALEAALAAGEAVLSHGGLYAMAAIRAGAAFVDFTPSRATTLPALHELARRAGVPLAGRDGKTGETLVKTALAPMFADRALRVRSWSGMNLLGGGDGETLADPVSAASKLESKAEPLEAILGYRPDGPVRIDHVADLGDWKTAWDLITFEGFLGTRMSLQFTWQGCDSSLAAPLVLDLARLSCLALQRGESGPLGDLGFFFKAPVGSTQHRLGAQFTALVRWVTGEAPEG